MRNIILASLAFSLGMAMSFAQNILQGKVTDQNNEGLLAQVHIARTEIGTLADFDGNFTLNNIPNGKYEVIITYLGYSTQSHALVFPVEDNFRLEITMKPSAVEMDAVILSIPFHKLQKDNVMKVEHLSATELSKQGAIGLSEGIQSIAGVNSIETGVGIGKPVIRGLSSNRVLTYAQGVRLENQQFGEEHGLGISDTGIESLEVIKGPASLLYGSDALGGVLYVNPERFAADDSYEADASAKYFSNTQGSHFNAGVKNTSNGFGIIARGGYTSHKDFKTGNGLRASNTRFDETDFKFGAQYKNENISSSLRYNFNKNTLGISEGFGEQSKSMKFEEPYQKVDSHIFSLNNTIYGDKSKWIVNLGYIANDRKEFEEHDHDHAHPSPLADNHDDEASLRLKLNTFNYNIQHHFPSTEHSDYIMGLQGMYQTNKNYGEEILIPDAKIYDAGVFLTSHHHINKIGLQAGLRFDTRRLKTQRTWNEHDQAYIEPISKNFNSLNAALGLKTDLSKQAVMRLNLATGFRAPNLAELTSDGVHHGTFRYEIGNVDLKSEQNFQVDLALEYYLSNVELYVNAFYNYIDDYIFLNPTGSFIEDNPVYHYTQKNAKLYGGELGFHIHPQDLTWFHIDNSYEMVIGKQSSGDYLPFIPAHSLNNTLRIDFKDGKLINNSSAFVKLKNTFKQQNTSQFETSTAGYSLVDLGFNTSIDWANAKIDLGISVTNLLDKTYYSHLSRLKEVGVYDIGRNIVLSTSLKI